MIERLLDVASFVGNWGYLIVFLAAFLESSAFLGLFVPGESIVVLAGFLTSQGYLKLGNCIAIISIGAVLGGMVAYSLGKSLGRGYFERHKRLLFIKAKHIEKVDAYFQNHGGKTVFLGKFIGFTRAIIPFVAGISGMSYWKFFVYNLIASTLWATGFLLLGHFFGLSWRAIEKWAGRAGVFIFFLLLVIASFSYLYRGLLKRQIEFRLWLQEKYSNIAASPRTRTFVKKHPRLVAFLKEGLSPGGYLGIHLVAGLILSALFVLIFGKIAEDVLTGEPLVVVDQWVLDHIFYFRASLVTQIAIAFTYLGGWAVILSGSLAIAAYLLVGKKIGYLAGYVMAVLGGSVLDFVLKRLIQRSRPITEDTLIEVSGFSFPSAHAMMSVIFYGMIVYFLIQRIQSRRLRLFFILSAAFIVFIVGFTRLYLQVHYLSDVIAGYAGGLFWLSVCITGLEIYRRRDGNPQRHEDHCEPL